MKKSTEFSSPYASTFWTPNTVDKYNSPYTPERESRKSEKSEFKLHSKEKYKWMMVQYDMERDNRLAQAQEIYQES